MRREALADRLALFGVKRALAGYKKDGAQGTVFMRSRALDVAAKLYRRAQKATPEEGSRHSSTHEMETRSRKTCSGTTSLRFPSHQLPLWRSLTNASSVAEHMDRLSFARFQTTSLLEEFGMYGQ
jgi:hypothetical protein